MVPDDNADGPTEAGPTAESGQPVGMDEELLYAVVREAVEDAVVGVVVRIALAGVVLALAWPLVVVAFESGGVASATGGTILAVVVVFLVVRVLGLVPPFSEWGE